MIVDRTRVAAALPGYELGAELGVGGFGLVLAARHRQLDRPVAVKIVPAGPDSAAEARLLAGLDHPHIVRIHDCIEAGELRLVVMELLAGGTLTHRRRKGMPPEGACAVGLAVAAALSCAHARGVLHRDVKTDNVLFDDTGLLKVTDFGIARLVEGSAATASAVVGTPAYMAPEQIMGTRLGPATDLYALGVVLYHLLTGAPLFDPALPVQALWQHHLATAPAPPAGVPAPVGQVVLAALAKDPAARPPSVHAFALDLAAAAADAYGPRWTARSGLVLRVDDDVRAAAGDQLPTPARPVPAAAPQPGGPPAAPSVGETSQMEEGIPSRGSRTVAPADQTTARALAADAHPGPPDSPRPPTPRSSRAAGRSSLVGWLRRRRTRFAAAAILLVAVTASMLAISYTPGANPTSTSNSATPPAASPLPTPSVPSLRVVGRPLAGHTDEVRSMAFSPDGTTLATGSWDGTVRLWDVADPSAPRVLATLEADKVKWVAFSPDGATLATSGWAGTGDRETMRLWDVADRRAPRLLAILESSDYLNSGGFAPEEATLATGSFDGKDGTVQLWDVANPSAPRLVATLGGKSQDPIAFSPDGATLATGSRDETIWDQTVHLWDVADPSTPRLLATLDVNDGVHSMAFSPDGATLAIGGDMAGQMWDVADPAHPRRLGFVSAVIPGGSIHEIFSMAFTPDGTMLATGSHDSGGVRLWDVTDLATPRLLDRQVVGPTKDVWSMAFAPNWTVLATGERDGTVRLWTAR